MHRYDDEESIYDEWGYHDSMTVSVDFLLPTGIYIPMDVQRNSTISEIKSNLWKEAIHYPLFSKLTNQASYSCVYITSFGLREEIVDEGKHLSEFDLIHELPVLKLIQTQGNVEEKRIIHEIHQLAGIKNEKELNVDNEYVSFRKEMRDLALRVSKERASFHWKRFLEQHYPPTVLPYLNETTHHLRDYGLIQLKYENIETAYTIKVNPRWEPHGLTAEAVHTWNSKSKIKLPTANPDDYVLKAIGKEFIVGNHKIYEFKCLRDALISKRDATAATISTPTLTLMHVGKVRELLPKTSDDLSQLKDNFPPPIPDKRRSLQVWPLWQMDNNFGLRVIRAGNVNVGQEKEKKLIVHIGLYHGFEKLCPTTYTKEHSKEGTGNEYFWDEECFFDIDLANLPQNSKLCISICTINKTKKSKKQDVNHKAFLANSHPIAWVNMMVFDFKQQLKTGLQRVNCWMWPENLDSNNLKPNGVVTPNPHTDESPFIELLMPEYHGVVKYPSCAEVLEDAARQASAQRQDIFPSSSKSHLLQLAEIVKKDRFDDLFDNEKNLLWFLRLDCRELYPEALSKVLNAVKWGSHQCVSMARATIEGWKPLSCERAMELLDSQFADERVRDFAVKCLQELRDDQLQQYLMQLVQVLKFDSYLDSSLVRFILNRAWNNRKIGHFLFWHLKAEITDSTPNIRISLILEAYLYGNIPHMKVLHKQYEALNKMRTLNERVKDPKFGQKEVKTLARKALQDTAVKESFAEALSQVECPLEPNLTLRELCVEDCKVMNSKMRPLWLEFNNNDTPDGKISVIYKNGDDLRQDMLTLQIISIMDMLWKSEGLDLRMIPYGCLATGKQCGMIEVVTHSNTIANIQKTKGGKMSAFRHQTLLEWVEQQNPSGLDKAIENFTYSCAGYCVATFVLGVGDRHSDNIMITENGQLFHIDFGHILGNFKSKYGIKRERVPFVLAHDFVHVINKGKNNEKKEFEVFRKLCDRAFCILRKKGYLFITLFALMMHSGLPELTSLDHLEYLRETLALHLSEEKALQQFRSKFNKALTDAWSTSVNWFFHNVHRA